jgi:hypothetical protein
VLAVTVEDVRNTALLVLAGAGALALLFAWVMKTIVSKLLSIVVLGALAAVVWSQRADVQACADRVGATLAAGAVDDTTCTFFGHEVTVEAPRNAIDVT